MSWADINFDVGRASEQIQNIKSVIDKAKQANSAFVSVAGAVGLAGFVFDRAKQSQVVLENEITEHYTEDGSPVSDHVARKPEQVTVSGYVGEYKNITSGEPSRLQKATQKLTTLGSYLPPLSDAAKSIYEGLQNKNESSLLSGVIGGVASNAVNTGLDVFKAYKNVNMPGNDQQKAYLFFEALRNSNALFTIETPWRTFTDMCIKTMRALQGENTRDVTEFEITFQKFNQVSTGFSLFDNRQGKNAAQASSFVQKGVVRGKVAADMSAFGRLFG